jgi:hypothetical protein
MFRASRAPFLAICLVLVFGLPGGPIRLVAAEDPTHYSGAGWFGVATSSEDLLGEDGGYTSLVVLQVNGDEIPMTAEVQWNLEQRSEYTRLNTLTGVFEDCTATHTEHYEGSGLPGNDLPATGTPVVGQEYTVGTVNVQFTAQYVDVDSCTGVSNGTLQRGLNYWGSVVCGNDQPIATDEFHIEGVNACTGDGHTIRSTWDLTKNPGKIVATKATDPADDPTEFTFTGALSGEIADGESLSKFVVPGSYEVTESEAAGWGLTEIECSGNGTGDLPSSTAHYEVAAGETVACTFTNKPLTGRIVIVKETDPAGSVQVFSFAGAVTGLLTDGQSLSQDVGPGTYTVTEAAVAGWSTSSITCDDTNSAGVPATRTASITVESGETVTCTFFNAGPLQFSGLYDHQVFFGGKKDPFTVVAQRYNGFVTGPSAETRVQSICIKDWWGLAFKQKAPASRYAWITRDALDIPDEELEAEYQSPTLPVGATFTAIGPHFCVENSASYAESISFMFMTAEPSRAAPLGQALPLTSIAHQSSFVVTLRECPTISFEFELDVDTDKNRKGFGELDEELDPQPQAFGCT